MSDEPKVDPTDKRQYRRIQAPVYCRPSGLRIFEGPRKVINISFSGMRMYSDEPLKVGTRLGLELFLPDDSSVDCKVEVVWIETLPEDSPAQYDVGFRFRDLNPEDVERLSSVLEP